MLKKKCFSAFLRGNSELSINIVHLENYIEILNVERHIIYIHDIWKKKLNIYLQHKFQISKFETFIDS